MITPQHYSQSLSFENSLGIQQQSNAKRRAVYTVDCFPVTKTEVMSQDLG